MKVWVGFFVCLNVKVVSMELSPGYSTTDFLLAYAAHVSQNGIPGYVHSDRGSQLVSAEKDVKSDTVRAPSRSRFHAGFLHKSRTGVA